MPNGPQPPLVVRDPPFWFRIRSVARSFGVPPWTMEHPERPPTEAETSVWFFREQYLSSVGL